MQATIGYVELVMDGPVPLPDRSKYTPEFRDAIEKCLSKDPAGRISAVELLHHPWLARWGITDLDVAQATMRDFFAEKGIRAPTL